MTSRSLTGAASSCLFSLRSCLLPNVRGVQLQVRYKTKITPRKARQYARENEKRLRRLAPPPRKKQRGRQPVVVKKVQLPAVGDLPKTNIVHGEVIWAWSNLRSNAVVYSLANQMATHDALKQLPYNGKKTKPADLRRDHWHPLCTIRFPKGAAKIGLIIFQKLRELRHLHEVSWDPESEPFRNKSKKDRRWALVDQRANSIADMAALLSKLRAGNKEFTIKAQHLESNVVISWRNIFDAEFAKEWGPDVDHTTMTDSEQSLNEMLKRSEHVRKNERAAKRHEKMKKLRLWATRWVEAHPSGRIPYPGATLAQKAAIKQAVAAKTKKPVKKAAGAKRKVPVRRAGAKTRMPIKRGAAAKTKTPVKEAADAKVKIEA